MIPFSPELARMARAALGQSLREVSQNVGVSINTLQKYEVNGGSSATANKLFDYYRNRGLIFIEPDTSSIDGIGYGIRIQDTQDLGFIEYWRKRINSIAFRAADSDANPLVSEPDHSDAERKAIVYLRHIAHLTAHALLIDAALNSHGPLRSLETLLDTVDATRSRANELSILQSREMIFFYDRLSRILNEIIQNPANYQLEAPDFGLDFDESSQSFVDPIFSANQSDDD
jgi:transcriptional regulator with XRE-family HTH domain